MSIYTYYVYNYYTRKLGWLDLLSEADESSFIDVVTNSRFSLGGRSFDRLDAFLYYLKQLNEKVALRYTSVFKIEPPYKVYQEIHNSICCTYVEAKNQRLLFTPGSVPSGGFKSAFENFLRSMRGHLFNTTYILQLHNFLFNSMIVKPATGGKFDVRLPDGNTIKADIRSAGTDREYLRLLIARNDAIFTFYGIPKDQINKIVKNNGFDWVGRWPETDRKTVYEIINYINANYYAGHAGSYMDKCVIVSGFHISYSGHDFVIRKHENGKWYIDGEIALIISMFGSSNIAEFRKFVDNVLGKKFRKGVFPECDSKEEILTLLNKITKCPT